MKWQGDGLPKQHPPWPGFNPAVYTVVDQVFLVMETPEEPLLILDHPDLFFIFYFLWIYREM